MIGSEKHSGRQAGGQAGRQAGVERRRRWKATNVFIQSPMKREVASLSAVMSSKVIDISSPER